MYYNSNRTSNDYYNSYKREIAELHAYRKEETIHKAIKWILTITSVIIFILGGIFLYNYFQPNITEEIPNIVINENELPQSVQLRASQSQDYIQANATDTYQETKPSSQIVISQVPDNSLNRMHEKDVELIVQIIMSQMNTQKEMPLEKALEDAESKTYVNKTLKEGNHFNKVVLTHAKVAEVQNASLIELSNSLDAIINESDNSNSDYENELKKEILFRQQEMRYIVVQKGDTLSKIAKRAYGSSDDYPKIFAANPEVLNNPNHIFVGQRLRIPA